MGRTLLALYEALKAKGAVVVGLHHTYADAFLPFYPYPTLTTGHPDALDFETPLYMQKGRRPWEKQGG